ncbi:metal ABC transporter substrate-binding protein [Nocardioides limicola]|uniref:metal ABC transporter substrate-binding protein n=1 Tax=Nocardioides limicola TaxID=2803368 RepID=UPI00193B40CD|nr:metal ABC transporter substrate-binding protein [Nocardioides sp. DJM-14]
MKRLPFRLSALAALPLIAASCATVDGSPGSDALVDDETPVAVAAFYPLYYVTDRIAGPEFDVVNLTAPGYEAHDLELSIRDTATLADAAVVVHLSGFQPAVDTGIANVVDGAVVIDAADVVDLREVDEDDDHGHEDEDEHGHDEDEHGHEDEDGHDEDEHGHDEDEDGHDEDEHGHDEDEDGHDEDEHGHDEDDDHGHDHGDEDPHFWLDPLRLADLGDAVAGAFAEASPEHADDFATRAAELRSDLEEIDAAYTTGLANCAIDTVVVSHNAFGYLTKYGLHFEPIAGLSPGAEPTPADLQRLQQVIRDEGVTTVFAETLINPRIAESLANDMGIETGVLDPIEGLTDESSEEDYLSLMRTNLAALTEAGGC